jgi:hypothetical protein
VNGLEELFVEVGSVVQDDDGVEAAPPHTRLHFVEHKGQARNRH